MPLHNIFYTAIVAPAARHTQPQHTTKRLRHKHKRQRTKLSFIPFPFGGVSCLRWWMRIKNIVMQKQLRIISRTRMAVCPFSYCHFSRPALPHLAFSRHLCRLPVYFRPAPGVRVFHLAAIGWFIFVYPSGRRMLSALPF